MLVKPQPLAKSSRRCITARCSDGLNSSWCLWQAVWPLSRDACIFWLLKCSFLFPIAMQDSQKLPFYTWSLTLISVIWMAWFRLETERLSSFYTSGCKTVWKIEKKTAIKTKHITSQIPLNGPKIKGISISALSHQWRSKWRGHHMKLWMVFNSGWEKKCWKKYRNK